MGFINFTLSNTSLATAIAFLSSAAFAGHESGNGGGGLRCKKNGRETTQLLDFREAVEFGGREIAPVQTGAVDDLINKGADRLEEYGLHYMAQFVREKAIYNYQTAALRSVFLGPNVSIVAPGDTNIRFIPSGCDLIVWQTMMNAMMI